MTSKFRHVLFLLILLIAACSSSSPTSKKGGGDVFGHSDQSKENQTGDIVYYLPSPDGGSGVTVPPGANPSAVCDEPVTIVSNELTEAKAGEEYHFDILAQGGCGQFTCALLEAPEWLQLNGCQLVGTPDAIGVSAVTVKVGEEEKSFQLSVKDNPKIILFGASEVLLFEAGKEPSFIDEEDNQFDVTLGQDAIYAKVDAFSSYSVSIANENFSISPLGGSLYKIKPAKEILRSCVFKQPYANEEVAQYCESHPSYKEQEVVEGVTFSVTNEHNETVTKAFDVTVYRDPCDHPLKIKPWKIFKEDDSSFADISNQIRSNKKEELLESGDANIDVDLGTKVHIIFKADGAEGPYQWSFSSKVGPKLERGPECGLFDFSLNLPLAGEVDFAPPNCSDDLLTTNEKWEVVALNDLNISQEDSDNNVYFKLTTDFSFKGKVLPYSKTFDYLIYDQLEVTAETSACHTETSLKEKAAYSLNHILKLPKEGVDKIQVTQKVDDVWDVNRDSRMWIHFKSVKGIMASVEYNLGECKDDYSECELAAVPKPNAPNSGFVDEIVGIEIEFADEARPDHWCWDCDHDQADYDLVSLIIVTPYRTFYYTDGVDGRFNNDMVPVNTDNVCVFDAVGLPCATGEGIYSVYYMHSTYSITPNTLPTESIWLPKSRPDY